MRLLASSIPPALLAGAFFLSHFPSTAATCYYPNGDTANDVPCNDETDESTCCGTGYACFGISSQYYLCMSTGDEIQKSGATTYVRGSCTDESWRSGNCPSVCVDPDRDDVSGGNGVAQCPDSETEYYCLSSGLGADNCSTGYQLIDFAATPTVLTTIGVLPSSTSSSSSPTSSSTSSSTTSSSPPAGSSTGTGTASGSGASNTGTASSGGPSKTAIGVGVSLGLFFGLGACAAAIFFFIRYRNKKRAEREAAAAVAGGGSPGTAGAYSSPSMSNAPAGYAPAPNYGLHPPNSTSPQPPSELYDAPYGSNKNTSYAGSPPPNQVIGEMPANESRYEMA